MQELVIVLRDVSKAVRQRLGPAHAAVRYTVIVLVGIVVATGWLALSVLSVVGSIVWYILDVPPTAPKWPTSPHRKPNLLRKSVAEPSPKQRTKARLTLPATDGPEQAASRRPKLPHPSFISIPLASQVTTPPSAMHPSLNSEAEPSDTLLMTSSSSDALAVQPDNMSTTEASASVESTDVTNAFVGEVNLGSPENVKRRKSKPKKHLCRRNASDADKGLAGSAPSPRRTDPYQAPYYFPTPVSPEAKDYVSLVQLQRQTGLTSPRIIPTDTPIEWVPSPELISQYPSPAPSRASSPPRGRSLQPRLASSPSQSSQTAPRVEFAKIASPNVDVVTDDTHRSPKLLRLRSASSGHSLKDRPLSTTSSDTGKCLDYAPTPEDPFKCVHPRRPALKHLWRLSDNYPTSSSCSHSRSSSLSSHDTALTTKKRKRHSLPSVLVNFRMPWSPKPGDRIGRQP